MPKSMPFRLANLMFALLASTLGLAQVNLIARLEPNANPKSVAHLAAVRYVEKAPGAPFFLFEVPAGADVHEAMVRLQSNPLVVWVEDDPQIEMPEHHSGGKGGTIGSINDRSTAYALNANTLRQIGFDVSFAQLPGRPVRIAILDTGLAPSLTQMWSRAVARYNAVESGQMPLDVPRGQDTSGNSIPDEGVGHGTFVAGLVDQISPRSLLVIARVADSDGISTAWRLIKGLSYSVAVRAEVANISLGAVNGIPALSDVIEWATQSGMFVVAAVGNNNLDRINYPARVSKVLSVTGVDELDIKAVFANYEGKVDSCAPATGILSYGPDNNMMVWSGTSFAAPMVSAGIIEGLRHTPRRAEFEWLLARVRSSGHNIDGLNPRYSGELGRRLWLPDLWKRIADL